MNTILIYHINFFFCFFFFFFLFELTITATCCSSLCQCSMDNTEWIVFSLLWRGYCRVDSIFNRTTSGERREFSERHRHCRDWRRHWSSITRRTQHTGCAPPCSLQTHPIHQCRTHAAAIVAATPAARAARRAHVSFSFK